jgi:hypothetical protein
VNRKSVHACSENLGQPIWHELQVAWSNWNDHYPSQRCEVEEFGAVGEEVLGAALKIVVDPHHGDRNGVHNLPPCVDVDGP